MKRGQKPKPCLWPAQPLIDAAEHLNVPVVPRAVGASGTTWTHALHNGLTDRQADRWAIRLGYHPIEIWPTWCDEKEQAA